MRYLILIIAIGCTDKNDDSGTSTTGGTTGTTGTTTTSGTSGSTTGGTTTGATTTGGTTTGGTSGTTTGGSSGSTTTGGTTTGGTTEVNPWSLLDYTAGITRTESIAYNYEWLGHQLHAYEVDSAFEVPFITPDGTLPRFQVLLADKPDPTISYGVILDLHGGSADTDSKKDPDGEDDRCTRDHASSNSRSRHVASVLPHMAASEGWIVITPENVFCDGWFGLGPDDPIDQMHGGYALAEVALGWLRWGQTDYAIDESRIAVLGTSLGSPGAIWYAAHTHTDLAAVVADSGPNDQIRFYYEKDYSPYELEVRKDRDDHIFGGAPYDDKTSKTPSEFYDKYVAAGLVQGLEDGWFTDRLFHPWNSGGDPSSPEIQHVDIEALAAKQLGQAGVDFVEYDLAHRDPDHTQVVGATPYLSRMVLDYIAGWSVARVEGEAAGADVGSTVSQSRDTRGASGDSWQATAAGDAGKLFEADSPLSVASGQEVKVAFMFFVAEAGASPLQDAATISVLEDGVVIAEATLTEAQMTWGETDWELMATAHHDGTLTATASGGTISARVETTGATGVAIDVVSFSVR